MNKQSIRDLIKRYHLGECSQEESALLESWYMDYVKSNTSSIPEIDFDTVHDQVWEKINHSIPSTTTQLFKYRNWWTVAASILVVCGFAVYFIITHGGIEPVYVNNLKQINPGTSKAILTLGDGTKVVLNDSAKRELARESNVVVTRTGKGQVTYSFLKSDKITGGVGVFNTIQTPRGGEYNIVLPDGTRVSLNSASSLKFPVTFSHAERRVILQGEAYFEVAHDKNKPFKVVSNQQETEVLGTHFNISNYPEDAYISTTLLQGKIMVHDQRSQSSKVLVPGQQSLNKDGIYKVSEVDTMDAVAWKNGLFRFNEESLVSIMNKISRWYDVDIVYLDNGLRDETYYGVINKFSKVSEILAMLERVGNAKFMLKGNHIVVSK